MRGPSSPGTGLKPAMAGTKPELAGASRAPVWHGTCAGAGGTVRLGVTRPPKGEAGDSALSQRPVLGSAASTAQRPDSAVRPTAARPLGDPSRSAGFPRKKCARLAP